MSVLLIVPMQVQTVITYKASATDDARRLNTSHKSARSVKHDRSRALRFCGNSGQEYAGIRVSSIRCVAQKYMRNLRFAVGSNSSKVDKNIFTVRTSE